MPASSGSGQMVRHKGRLPANASQTLTSRISMAGRQPCTGAGMVTDSKREDIGFPDQGVVQGGSGLAQVRLRNGEAHADQRPHSWHNGA